MGRIVRGKKISPKRRGRIPQRAEGGYYAIV
jgi:hypothetical protein